MGSRKACVLGARVQFSKTTWVFLEGFQEGAEVRTTTISRFRAVVGGRVVNPEAVHLQRDT